MSLTISPLCLTLSLTLNLHSVAANPTLSDIIAETQKNLQRPPAAIDVETTVYALDPNGLKSPQVLQMEIVTYRKDGKRIDITTNRYTLNREGKLVSDDFSTWNFCNNEYSFSSQNSGGHQTYTFQKTEAIQTNALFVPSNGNTLDGYFNHNNSDGHWTEIFEKEIDKVILSDAKEMVNDRACLVLKADTSCGSYTLWLDPQQKFTLREAHILIDANDRVWGKPLKDSFIPFKCYGPPAGRHFQTMEVLLDNIKTEVIDGYVIPVEGIYTEHWTFDDGHRMDNQHRIRRSNIIWNPDFKALGAFEMDMPEGTVFLEDLGKGNYKKHIWSQGKMVPNENN